MHWLPRVDIVKTASLPGRKPGREHLSTLNDENVGMTVSSLGCTLVNNPNIWWASSIHAVRNRYLPVLVFKNLS